MKDVYRIVLVGAFIVFGPAVVLGIILGLKYNAFVGVAASLVLFVITVWVCYKVMNRPLPQTPNTDDVGQHEEEPNKGDGDGN